MHDKINLCKFFLFWTIWILKLGKIFNIFKQLTLIFFFVAIFFLVQLQEHIYFLQKLRHGHKQRDISQKIIVGKSDLHAVSLRNSNWGAIHT